MILRAFIAVCLSLSASAIEFSGSSGSSHITGNLNVSGAFSDGSLVNVKSPPFNALGNDTGNDQPAIQAALNYALGTNNTRTDLNRQIYIPAGTYRLGSALLITNVRNAKIIGAGRNATILKANYAGPAFRTDGLWYSQVSGIRFDGAVTHTNGVFELDGNRAQNGSTIGVQANTFSDCMFNGNGIVAYGLAIVHQSGGYGQGSENIFLNCHWQSSTNAGYFCNGPNALQNTIIGGNFQACPNDGIWIRYGHVVVMSTGFQNTTGGILSQTGYDVHIENGDGSYNGIYNCRSESIKFIKAESGPVTVDGWRGVSSGYSTWTPDHAYALNAIVSAPVSTPPTAANGFLFKCTTSGTSGIDEPEWSTTGPTTDGGATWTIVDIVGVSVTSWGSIRNSTFPWVRSALASRTPLSVEHCTWTRPDWLPINLYSDTAWGDGRPPANGPILIGNLVSGSLPYTVKANGSTGLMQTNQSMANFGRSPLIMSGGSGGVTWADVGFWRNDGTSSSGTEYADSKNVIGVVGSLGKPQNTNVLSTGDDFVIVGGLGSSAGGAIRFMTQPAGSTSAVTRLTIANDGTLSIGGISGITTIWTNMIPNVITQRISTISGVVVTNLTL